MTDGPDDLKQEFARLEAKLLAPLDQALAAVRDEYGRLSAADRRALRQWAEALSSIKLPADIPVFASARVSFLIHEEDNQRTVDVASATLVEAIQAWERAEEFLPEIFD